MNEKTQLFGYHLKDITKGELGEFSKIKEEFEELEDAEAQKDPIMILCECSDLICAISHYISKWNMTIFDLQNFNHKTERAFKAGKR